MADATISRLDRKEAESALQRICDSKGFASSPRLIRFLRYVVERALDHHPDQIHEFAIGIDVYDRGQDFDPKADAIVRVEARRLRKALEQYYQSEGADDAFVISIEKGGYKPSFRRTNKPRSYRALAVAAAVGAVALLVAATITDREPEIDGLLERTLLQVTSDDATAAWPDITSDGALIVFSSDRDGGPDLDLWLLHIDRSTPTRLTDEPGDEAEADFSPDGSLVVYTSYPSSRIYTIPTLGGEPRLIAEQGKFPHFAPDGESIVFTEGRRGASNHIVLLDLASGRRTVLGDDLAFLGAGSLWLPNGKLLSGGRARDKPAGDWFLVPIDGSAPIGVGADPANHGLSLSRPPPFEPQAWLEPEGGVLFSARHGDSTDIWLRPFSLTSASATSPPIRLTQGAALVHDLAASPTGRIVYASLEQNTDLWRLPLDVLNGKPTGPPERLTSDPSSENYPRSAPGGRNLFYRRSPSARNEARSQLLVAHPGSAPRALLQGRAGNYSSIHVHQDDETFTYSVPVTPSYNYAEAGARKAKAAQSRRQPKVDVFEATLDQEVPKRVCESCPLLRTVSPDGRYRLHVGEANNPKQVVAHEAGSQRRRIVLEHPDYWIDGVTFSPAGDWMSFRAWVRGDNRTKRFLAPFRPDDPPPEGEWIEIAPAASVHAHAIWSPNGELLFYVSDENGAMAIRAVRLDRETRKPLGSSWAVHAGGSDAAIRSFSVTGIGTNRLALVADALVFDAVNQRGNIWMLDPR